MLHHRPIIHPSSLFCSFLSIFCSLLDRQKPRVRYPALHSQTHANDLTSYFCQGGYCYLLPPRAHHVQPLIFQLELFSLKQFLVDKRENKDLLGGSDVVDYHSSLPHTVCLYFASWFNLLLPSPYLSFYRCKGKEGGGEGDECSPEPAQMR